MDVNMESTGLLVISHLVVALIFFLIGTTFREPGNNLGQLAERAANVPFNINKASKAELWSRIREHITNRTLECEEAQAILEKIGPYGWFGRLASIKRPVLK